MNILKNIIIIIAATIVFASCTHKKVAKEDLALNIICLVDFSKSIPAGTMNWYKQTIENNILINLQTSDRITVLPIDRGSETAAREILSADLYEFASGIKVDADNKMQEAEKREQAFADYINNKLVPSLNNGFDSFRISRQNMSDETDIIGALGVAGKYFRNDMRNVIVVFSDMIQYSDELKISKRETADKIESKCVNISIPEIKNGEVLILTGEQPAISSVQMNEVRSFWTNFLQKQNVQLIGYGSGELVDLNRLVASN